MLFCQQTEVVIAQVHQLSSFSVSTVVRRRQVSSLLSRNLGTSFKMIIYKDKLTGDELFSDSFCPKLDDDGVCYYFDVKMKQYKEGQLDDALFGANASAEQNDDCHGHEEGCETEFDFVKQSRLQKLEFGTKKELIGYFKEYFKKLIGRVTEEAPERVDDVKKMADIFVKKWVKQFNDLTFYQGESGCGEGCCCILVWNDDGMSGKCYVFRDSLAEEKV